MVFRIVTVLWGVSLLANIAFSQLILISRNQEIEMGKEVAAALEKEYGVWDDPEQTRRIERIGRSLVAVCERKDMPYTFKILNERKELNAMTAPGGFIYITRALLEALESDDEVAFVLGHEIGHVTGDHIRKQLSQAIAGSLLLDILTGRASRLVRIGTDIMFSLYQRGYSRQHERDADSRSVRYMKAAGYNPVAAITALKKLGMERYKGLIRWFGTHPDVPSRIQRIAKMLRVDPETLEPLPQKALIGSPPKRSASLFFLSEGALFRLPSDSSQPQRVWQLEKQRVEKFQVSEDGKTVWMLIRRENSGTALLAIWRQGVRKTEFVCSLHADEILDFRLSPDGGLIAVLAREGDEIFVKVFDKGGKEVAAQDRTPLGAATSIQWMPDGELLVFTKRFGETSIAIWDRDGTFKFVPMNTEALPVQSAALPQRTLFVLTNEVLKRGQIDSETVSLQPIASPVTAFAVSKRYIAVVNDEGLQLLTAKDPSGQGLVIDERKGEFADLTFSKDGEWLAYTYRKKPSDQPQLWLSHVQTGRIWRVAMNATSPMFAGR